MNPFDYDYHEAEREQLVLDEIKAYLKAGKDLKEAEALAEQEVPSVYELYQDALCDIADAMYEQRREMGWED